MTGFLIKGFPNRFALWAAIVAISAASCASPSGKGDSERAGKSRTETAGSDKITELTDKILDKPNNPNLYISRALAYSDKGMYNLAIKDVDRAMLIDSTVSHFHATRGEIFFKSGDLRSARLSLEKAVDYDKENTEALLKLGEVNFLLRRYPQALMSIDEALRVNQRLPKGYFLKGFIFKEIGDTTKSISSFQTATEVNPDYYEAFMELGHIYAFRGDPIALDYINSALELRPSSTEAWYHKGIYYQSKAMFGEAAEAYENLVKQDPKAFLGYYNLGYLYLTESDQYETALAYFDTVLTIRPESIDAVYNRGVCFEELGDEETAAEIYREVLTQDPQHTQAAQGLSRLLE